MVKEHEVKEEIIVERLFVKYLFWHRRKKKRKGFKLFWEEIQGTFYSVHFPLQ